MRGVSCASMSGTALGPLSGCKILVIPATPVCCDTPSRASGLMHVAAPVHCRS